MKNHALLFGSIGTLIETSELQRKALNTAFLRSGLNWHWTKDYYRSELAISGGQSRIERYARIMGQQVDSAAIHAEKTRLFNAMLAKNKLPARPGVVECIDWCLDNNVALGFVTTTSKDNVLSVLDALSDRVSTTSFDFIGTRDDVVRVKPSPDIYQHALRQLGVAGDHALAIEDSQPSLQAAADAAIRCIAFPGSNTLNQDYTRAILKTRRLESQVIECLLADSSSVSV